MVPADTLVLTAVSTTVTVSENTNILTTSATQSKSTDVQYVYSTYRDRTGTSTLTHFR